MSSCASQLSQSLLIQSLPCIYSQIAHCTRINNCFWACLGRRERIYRSSMATPAGVRQLYRAFLREGVRFPNYNMREYIKRRARDGFRENAALSDASAVEAAWGEGKEQLGVVRRQSVVYGLYARKQKTVMEVQ